MTLDEDERIVKVVIQAVEIMVTNHCFALSDNLHQIAAIILGQFKDRKSNFSFFMVVGSGFMSVNSAISSRLGGDNATRRPLS